MSALSLIPLICLACDVTNNLPCSLLRLLTSPFFDVLICFQIFKLLFFFYLILKPFLVETNLFTRITSSLIFLKQDSHLPRTICFICFNESSLARSLGTQAFSFSFVSVNDEHTKPRLKRKRRG